MSARPNMNAASLNATAMATLPDLLRQWLPGGEYRDHLYVALNPLRTDRHLGSFQIDIQTGRWADHAIGCAGRDPVSLYAYLFTQGNYRDATKRLAANSFVQAAMATSAAGPTAKAAKPARAAADKVALARRIYMGATDLAGTPAESYLLSRGLLPTKAWRPLRTSMLRYPKRGLHPALIAPITSLDGLLVGIHRTFLQAGGAKLAVPAPKLVLGQIRGCAIRLGEPRTKLILCEGLEDGLTLYQELHGHPVWVSAGASLMAAMRIPNRVRSIVIAADNDPAGKIAADKAADILGSRKRGVKIMRPSAGFKDFNDELRQVQK